jgi:hypothetical protein
MIPYGFRKHFTRYTVAGTLLAFALFLISAEALLPRYPLVALVAALIPTALIGIWLYLADSRYQKQIPTTTQFRTPVRNQRMGHRSVYRILHYLEDDEEVLDVRHRSLLWLARQIWGPLVLALLLLAVSIALTVVSSIPLPQHLNLPKPAGKTATTTSKPATIPIQKPELPNSRALKAASKQLHQRIHWPKSITISWWIPLIPLGLMILPLLVVFRRWVYWVCYYFMVTTKRVHVIEEVFAILPFTKGSHDPFSLSDIKKANVEGSEADIKWGRATLSIATLMQGDEEESVHGIVGLANADDLEVLINDNVKRVREATEDVHAQQTQEHVTALKENTVAQRELAATIRELFPKPEGASSEAPTQEL